MKITAILLTLLNAVSFFYVYILTSGPVFFIGGTIAAVILCCQFLLKRKGNLRFFGFWLGFVLLALCWLWAKNYTASILMTLLAIFDHVGSQQKSFVVNDAFVQYKSFPGRKFHWRDISQLILKNDVLSLDLKNNQLLQFTLGETQGFTELEFNEFCQQMVEGSKE